MFNNTWLLLLFLVMCLAPALLSIPLFRCAERYRAHWARWRVVPYLGLKWFLIAMGAFIACGLAVQEIQEHHVGLGTGILTMVILATVKGITNAITSHMPSSPSGHQDPPLVQ